VFRNSSPERPAVYFSTVSEPLEKIVRFGQTLDFFDRTAIGSSVFYEDLGTAVSADGVDGVLSRIVAVVKERRPGLIVIDSFKALHAFADGHGQFRKFLHELAGKLTAFPTSSLWVGEYEDSEIGVMPEFAVADAILDLSIDKVGQREIRFLRVSKVRGSGFRSGDHAFRLSASGLHLFPRLADTRIDAVYELDDARVSSGIGVLDDLLVLGYRSGASTLVAGPSGSGKTLMGLHFIFEGLRRGEPGVIASLQENATQLQRVAEGFGWSLIGPKVEVMYRSAVDIYIDEWIHELLQLVERAGAKRVLIDSLTDLRVAAGDETRFREFVYSLVQRFSRQAVSVLMTFEIPDLFHADRLSESAVSHLSDNLVLLNYVKDDDSIGRAMCVIKTRASHHEPGIPPFTIGPDGIEAVYSSQR